MNSRKNLGTRPLRRTSLAIGLGLGLVGTGVFAQSTTGTIFGQAKAGETVVVKGSSGVTRQATVGADGRYTVGSLPVGSYTVTLQRDGQVVDSRSNVSIRVGSGTDVSFGAQNAQNLAAVTVQANALPSIDVSAVDSRTVITAEQLKQLPLGRSPRQSPFWLPAQSAAVVSSRARPATSWFLSAAPASLRMPTTSTA